MLRKRTNGKLCCILTFLPIFLFFKIITSRNKNCKNCYIIKENLMTDGIFTGINNGWRIKVYVYETIRMATLRGVSIIKEERFNVYHLSGFF